MLEKSFTFRRRANILAYTTQFIFGASISTFVFRLEQLVQVCEIAGLAVHVQQRNTHSEESKGEKGRERGKKSRAICEQQLTTHLQ